MASKNAGQTLTFKNVPVVYAELTGAGHQGKTKEKDYTIALSVDKKTKKEYETIFEDFWEENKSRQADEPTHDFKKWFAQDTNDKKRYVIWLAEVVSKVSEDNFLRVANEGDFEFKHFETMGAGSIVDVEFRIFHWNNENGEGIGNRLRSVMLHEYTKRENNAGASLGGKGIAGTKQPSSGSAANVEDFLDAVEDEDIDEAKLLLKSLKDHEDYKKFKKMIKKM